MPDMLYVGLQDDNRIAVFALDRDNGELTKRADVEAAGGPSVMAISPDRNTLYVGYRVRPSIASYRIDPATGGLSLLGTTAQADAPTFLAPDRAGRYMLCAYYQGGHIAVYPIAADGTIGAAPADKHETAIGAHAIGTDPSNRFAFVPHIARIQDNVLEPPKNNPGPNMILQYRFDAQTGRLSPNAPHRVEQRDLIGPRHYIHHPNLDVVYFSNEQGCGVTAYRLDRANGTLSSMETISTLPAGHSERTTCSQIHLTPSGRFLYVGNRAVNGSSIAAFAVDPATGHLTAAGHIPTETVPSAFCLDPAGHFLFAVGTASGRLASYRINQQSGALMPLAVAEVGQRPAAVLATRLG
jgi:6-phosphogluconolactonase